ncbi:MAG: hypothetical protein AB1Z19_01560 [Eubacteriales bacterium]
MIRFKRIWTIIILVLVMTMVLDLVIPQNALAKFYRQMSAATNKLVLNYGDNDRDAEEQLKVIIAVDTSKTMAEGFPGVDETSNILQSTVVLAELLSSRPNTSVQYLPFCRDMNQQDHMLDGDEAVKNITLNEQTFYPLSETMADLKQNICEYEMPIGEYTAINAGFKKLEEMIEDEENTRYAVVFITDGKTKEDVFSPVRNALARTQDGAVDFYLIYPETQANEDVIADLSGFISEKQQCMNCGVKNKDGLLKAYLDISNHIIEPDYKTSIEWVDLNAIKQDNTFAFSVSSDHSGLAVAAPEGYFIKDVTLAGALNKPISLYSAPDAIFGVGSQGTNEMMTIDPSVYIEESKERNYEYTIVICPYETASEENQIDAKPMVYVLRPAQDRFCVSVWVEDEKQRETRGGTARRYSTRSGVDVMIRLEYTSWSEENDDAYTFDAYEIILNDFTINPGNSEYIRVDADNSIIELVLPAEGDDTKIDNEVRVFNSVTEKNKEVIIIESPNGAPKIDSNASNKDIEFSYDDEEGSSCDEPGCINLVFGEESTASVLLNGIAVDPEGEEVAYFFDSGEGLKSDQYEYVIVKIENEYFLLVEKVDLSMEGFKDEMIEISFRDEKGKADSHEFYVVNRD